MSHHLEDLTGAECIIDDGLVWGKTSRQHDDRLLALLHRARERNLTFNIKKAKIGMSELLYVEHRLTSDGLQPAPAKTAAIVDMPPPTDKAGMLCFLGMIRYLHKFLPNLSDITAPLRALTAKDALFTWDSPLADSFRCLKQLVSASPVLTYFDADKPATLSVDASSRGLGPE